MTLVAITGNPGKVRSSTRSYDTALARRLCEVSAQVTGVDYALAPTHTPIG